MLPASIVVAAVALAAAVPVVRTVAAPDAAEAAGAASLTTPWTDAVDPAAPWPEHPRPSLVRDGWWSLNGRWSYAIRPRGGQRPPAWDGSIVVPYPVESRLSGVQKSVARDQELWYRRTFAPPPLEGGRLLLHFGAVDWRATVWLNGVEIGTHEGGYDPFTFDITDALDDSEQQDLVVSVWDPTDAGVQPRGKQVSAPSGIWYTGVTGIWQSVWLERVPAASIASLRTTTIDDGRALQVIAAGRGTDDRHRVHVRMRAADEVVAEGEAPIGSPAVLRPDAVRPWSPDDPFLYDLEIELRDAAGRPIDAVRSYAGLRTVAVRRAEDGHNRIFLNGAPLFMFGPLDQGWWPDGLYTAATDDALRHDVETTRRLGFNMCRKHVKSEPERWYWWCDRLGLLVWQDMPSGDASIGVGDPDLVRTAESETIYRRELAAMVSRLANHPSIVAWVPFNEGWGQFRTNEILAWTRSLDPTRLVDGPSGWADRGAGDLHDAHVYPGPGMFPSRPASGRASVLGEFGGLGLAVRGHLWQEDRNWGYRSFESAAQLQEAYEQLVAQIPSLVARGLAAAVYTQTSDVEIEVNGLMTYDRRVLKLDEARTRDANLRAYLPPPVYHPVLACAADADAPRVRWQHHDGPAEGDWQAVAGPFPGQRESEWKEGEAGFGRQGTPGAIVRTPWESAEILLRRAIDMPALDDAQRAALHWRLHHDEDVEIWIDGEKVLERAGYTTDYVDLPMSERARALLTPGAHVIAVRCRQTGGGQYIDVGAGWVEQR